MFGLFSFPMVLLYAALYGVTMKTADLLNEHGLKLFRGSAVLFGALWGAFGVLLVLSNNALANVILAMNIAFIIRNRLDFINHGIAASTIIIGFLASSVFEPFLFLAFYCVFLIFGSLKDYSEAVGNKKIKLVSALRLNEVMFYYPVPAFVYCAIYGEWIVFWAMAVYIGAYDLTKYFAKKRGYK
ncbi:MAG: hypothetical protein V1676_05210 [Candidatus Diapherotrites archaeon]